MAILKSLLLECWTDSDFGIGDKCNVGSCGYHADRGATDALSEKGIEKESNTEDEADSYTKMVYREAEFHVPVRPLHVSSIMLMALVDLLTYNLGEKGMLHFAIGGFCR